MAPTPSRIWSVFWLIWMGRFPSIFPGIFPNTAWNIPPTPLSTLEQAYRLAREKLDYVYIGNVGDPVYSRTDCPRCGAVLVERSAYGVKLDGVKNRHCAGCGEEVDLIL